MDAFVKFEVLSKQQVVDFMSTRYERNHPYLVVV